MADELTNKQRAFVDAYLGEAHFVAQTAAKMAGYSERSAHAQGSDLLKNVKVKAEIDRRLNDLQSQGMRIRVQRIQALERLLANLRQVQAERAAKALERYQDGEDVPTEALTGLMVETMKTYGAGAAKVTETVWEIDKTLVQEQQKLIDQIARESGDKVADKLQLSGDPHQPLVVETAKAKLLALMEEGNESDPPCTLPLNHTE